MAMDGRRKEMKVCPNCNAQLNETAKFCTECGSKTDTAVSTHSPNVVSAVPSEQPQGNTSSMSAAIDTKALESSFFDYLDFLKDTVIAPTSVFKQISWINGLISMFLFTIVQSIVAEGSLFENILPNILLQVIVVGVLFALNKFIFHTADSVFNVVTEYGGLLNTQTILFILVGIFGIDEGVGLLLVFIAGLNQMNIYNIYLFNSQSKGSRKVDGYYQIIISYIALSILLYVAFMNFV